MDAKRPEEKEHIGKLTELQGRIERITHTGEENGITAARVKVPSLR